jgi:hypothetical protein
MSPGATFERVYISLKEMMRSGVFAPGQHLDPGTLGAELSSSITPVRDALHRLVGERLVEAPRNDGFRAPLLTEIHLRQLYGWNLDLLLMAIRSARKPAADDLDEWPDVPPDAGPHEITSSAEALFLRIGHRSANPEHAIAIASTGDRLNALRLIEHHVIADAAEELTRLVQKARSEEGARLRHALTRYHRRRARAAAFLLEALHGPPAGRPTRG